MIPARRFARSLLTAAALGLSAACLSASVPTPKEHFGFNIGDDYHLTTYRQTEAYFKQLAATSDRVKLVDIGETEEGRRQLMLIVSSPANLAKIDRYKTISGQMARAEALSEEQALALSKEGKPVIWIDGGLHSTEVVATHQLIETAWQLATRTDEETLTILDKVVILLGHANPDGHDLVSDWYMRRPKAESRVMDAIPRLYQKYIGHDNNRDFMMMTQKETTNLARIFYLEWFPQVIYNHHQTGPAGTVVASAPYRDPFSYNFDPLVMMQLDQLGGAMSSRWSAEGKAGFTQKEGSVFSVWYNGGLRTTGYFHNITGILTEIIGSPTPMQIPLVPERLIPSSKNPMPIKPQKWHFRQSIDYSLTANYAVLNYAARHGDELLMNMYRMGQNSIERGSRDHWTVSPARIDAMIAAEKAASAQKEIEDGGRLGNHFTAGIDPKYYSQFLQDPERRDPRGFIIPADQADFPTAVHFINTLIKSGIKVHQATADFTVNGKKYPSGSYVVKTDQAFRPYVMDSFEPQDYPNDFRYEGGPPTPPYDAAGWTIAFQMGVKFDRVLDAFDGPFKAIPYGELQLPLAAPVTNGAAGYLVSHRINHSFILANRLLKAGADVFWLKDGIDGDANFGPGAVFIPATPAAKTIVEAAAKELGVPAHGVATAPTGEKVKLAPMRIALWDTYGGSMPSGWIRWILEKYEFNNVELVFAQDIDAGKLRDRFDVLILPTGSVPMPKSMPSKPTRRYQREPKAEDIPAEFRGWLGSITEEKSIPALKAFVEAGGTIVTTGTGANIGYHLGVPLHDGLTEITSNGTEALLPAAKFYVPGSILNVAVDPTVPLAWGMEPTATIFYDNDPAFKLSPAAVAAGAKPALWIDSKKPLKSGWAWGQAYLLDTSTAIEAPVGKGKLFLLTTQVTFRAQTHGTYKLFMNGLFLSTAKDVK
jgi:hypothetical protein